MVDWKIWEEIYKPSTHRFIANENPLKVKMATDAINLPLQTKCEGDLMCALVMIFSLILSG